VFSYMGIAVRQTLCASSRVRSEALRGAQARHWSPVCFWLSVGALLTTQACVVGPRRGGGNAVPSEPRHWVQDDRLREIMVELESLDVKSWPQEIEAEYSQAQQYQLAQVLWEARQLADGLAWAASKIPDAVAHIDMTEVDARSFQAQVDTLGEQAARLRDAAALGDQMAMRRVLDAIEHTCTSCHERFRDFSGPLERSAPPKPD